MWHGLDEPLRGDEGKLREGDEVSCALVAPAQHEANEAQKMKNKNEHCAALAAPFNTRFALTCVHAAGRAKTKNKKPQTDFVMNSSDSTFAQHPHRIISQPHVAGDKLRPAHATMAAQAGSKGSVSLAD